MAAFPELEKATRQLTLLLQPFGGKADVVVVQGVVGRVGRAGDKQLPPEPLPKQPLGAAQLASIDGLVGQKLEGFIDMGITAEELRRLLFMTVSSHYRKRVVTKLAISS